MKIQLRKRILSLLQAMVMLFALLPTSVRTESLYAQAPTVRLSVSADHVFVGDGPVSAAADLSGGTAPYEVTFQAARNGAAVCSEVIVTGESAVRFSFSPETFGEYTLTVSVHDTCHMQASSSASLAVAEHDAETERDWDASVSGASRSGSWGSSLLSVARTQVGYCESEKDFILRKGEKQAYSRYGDWYGLPYADWNIAFLAFAASYAGIPNDVLLSGASCRSWLNGMRAKDAFFGPDSGYTPKPGDIAFLGGSRAAVVERVSGSTLSVIEGDVNGKVARKKYDLARISGVGDTGLMQGLHNGSATPVPSENENGAAATPAETPLPEEEILVFQPAATPGTGGASTRKKTGNALNQMADQMNSLIASLDAAATAAPGHYAQTYHLMDAALARFAEDYLRKGETTPIEIEAFVQELSFGELFYLTVEIEDLAGYGASIGLTEADSIALEESEKPGVLLSRSVMDRWQLVSLPRADASPLLFYPIDGDTEKICVEITFTLPSVTGFGSGSGSAEMNDGVITTSAKGISTPFARSSIAQIRIINASAAPAEIGFAWTQEKVSSLKLNDVACTDAGGTYCSVVDIPTDTGDNAVVFQLVTGKNATVNTLKLMNFTFEPLGGGASVTLQYDEQKGMVTVNDVLCGSGDIVPAADAVFTAVPLEGMAFIGWFTPENKLISADATLTLKTESDTALHALFAGPGDAALFLADGQLFTDLTKADAAATALGGETIVLLNSGVLSGAHTISGGNTLLIPFDAAHTLYTSAPECTGKYTKPEAYRTLTFSGDASLTVYGTLSLSAKHHAGDHGQRTSGAPTGPVGAVQMNSGSEITIKSGGRLYAWGFITGEGKVTAERGAAVYENFQVADYRGSTATAAMAAAAEMGVFPLSQYYVQNIEVPLTLEAGAKDYAVVSCLVNGVPVSSTIPFIGGSGAMFAVSTGSLTRRYEGGTDRVTFDASGALSLSPFQMTFGGQTLQTQQFVLPLNGNITLHVRGQLSLAQNVALLPGARLIIDSGVDCTLGSGVHLYVYDAAQWGGYCGGVSLAACAYAPGRTCTRSSGDFGDAEILVNGSLDASEGTILATVDGANIHSDGSGRVILHAAEDAVTHMASQSGSNVTYHDIPVSPPPLRNGDGSSVLFPGDAIETVPFVSADGVWSIHCYATSDPVDKPGGVLQDETTGRNIRHYLTGVGANASYDSQSSTWVSDSCAETGTYQLTCPCGGANTGVLTASARPHTGIPLHQIKPGCTSQGYTLYVCSVCGNSYHDDYTAATGHSYVQTLTQPTCTADGFITCTCQTENCQHSYTVHPDDEGAASPEVLEALRALNHPDVTDYPQEDPTCQQNGLTAGRYCNTCGVWLTGREVLTADHAYDPDAAVLTPATCMEDAFTTTFCRWCSAPHVETQAGTALNHRDKFEVPAQNSTCTEDGYTAGVYCPLCESWLSGHETIKAAHAWGDYVETPATCLAASSRVRICAVCQVAEADSNYVPTPAHGHSYSEWLVTPATCTENGQQTRTCIYGCNDGNATQTELLPAIGHTEEQISKVDPQCGTVGWSEGVKCSVCGTILTAPTEIPALDHVWSDWAPLPGQEATCMEAGKQSHTCALCGNTEEADQAALGHDWKYEIATAATCTQSGEAASSECLRCHVITGGEVIPSLGHTYRDADGSLTESLGVELQAATCLDGQIVLYTCTRESCEEDTEGHTFTFTGVPLGHDYLLADGSYDPSKITAVIPVTCKSDGYTEYTCTRCADGCIGHTVKTDIVVALNHRDSYSVPQQDSTCTENGYAAGVYCPLCESWLSGHETIEAAHSWGEWTESAASCETAGSRMRACTVCDETAADDAYASAHPALNHPTESRQAATCTAAETCGLCGTALGEPRGHSMSAGETVPPSCKEGTPGYTLYVCERCAYSEQRDPQPAMHTPGTAATCTEDQLCTVCQTVLTPRLGHLNDISLSPVPPTCTEDGLTEGIRCSRCGADSLPQQAVPALGHDHILADGSYHPERGSVYQTATCDQPEILRYTCSLCGTFADVAGAVRTHDLISHPAKAPTCTEVGWSAYEECRYADCTYTTYAEIEVAGHTAIIDAAVAPTCTDPGLSEGSHCSVCYEVLLPQEELPASGHQMIPHEGKKPTFTADGWEAYETCEVCGLTTKVALPALGEPDIASYADFISTLPWLEKWAVSYAMETGADPIQLIIRYIRTGVSSYSTAEWATLAGSEDVGFAAYVREQEDLINVQYDTVDEMVKVSGLKNLTGFRLPNGESADFGRLFGVMDIAWHNGRRTAYADAAGWAGTLVHLMKAADEKQLADGNDPEALTDVLRTELLGQCSGCTWRDLRGDMDAFHLLQHLNTGSYQAGRMTDLFSEYFTASLSDQARAAYLLKQRFDGAADRSVIRAAVYNAYTGNSLMASLEDRHGFTAGDSSPLRRSVCHAFADYLQEAAGIREGWYEENGEYRHYAGGKPQTGIQLVDGLFYDFGADGVNIGKTPYTGKHTLDGNAHYIQQGKICRGWILLEDGWHCYDAQTGAGLTGAVSSEFPGITYAFDAGRLLSGVWQEDGLGRMYYYGPDWYRHGWQSIDGESYFFESGYAATGIRPVQEKTSDVPAWHVFTDTGVCTGLPESGFYWWQNGLYYVENDGAQATADRFGLYQVNDHWYYALQGSLTAVNQSCHVSVLNDLPLEAGWYRFDDAGRMIMTTGVAEESGMLYFYREGRRVTDVGLVRMGEGDALAYYCIAEDGTVITDATLQVDQTNGLLPEGVYCFGADGKMFQRLAGDANADSLVDTADMLLVMQYSAGENVQINLLNADVNGDDRVTPEDGLLLMQFCSGWEPPLI